MQPPWPLVGMEESVRHSVLLAPALALVASLSLSACSNGSNSAITVPTAPTTTTTTPGGSAVVTQTFTGNLNSNGAATLPFTMQAGTVTATLTTLGDPAVTVGLALGDWSGSACTIAVANDAALTGATVTGSVTGTANVCVRIYDVGFVTTTIPFTITITHP